MKEVFIPTRNYQRLEGVFTELMQSSIGIEMAEVIGPYGRGKTYAAERLVAQHGECKLIYFEPRFSIAGLIREMCFVVAGTRPRSSDACVGLIQDELRRNRHVLMVDEADQMSLKHLNQLRAFHDRMGLPIILLGESALLRKIAHEGRLARRVREVLQFDPVSQADLVVYYRKALDLAVAPEHSVQFLRHAKGDFGKVVLDALRVERMMRASGLKAVTDALVGEVVK